ncbi:MAG: Na(+)-translocating NADH-quinone reductase subunit C [Gammaproteobacteria bacterium]|nr:Na(+)-translocating NADH-quinone reductase subunit C [Gammaproteobacteria bacterium]MCF6362003.1 Na(+)-translocating NADH-quinone reductase subunit C [Gammaproteobacteria bacterium]
MTNDSPLKAILVVLTAALVCSIVVSVAAVSLRPYQLAHQIFNQAQHIVKLAGLMPTNADALSKKDLMDIFLQLDARVIDIDAGKFEKNLNPVTFDQRKAAVDPERSVTIPTEHDVARLGRRSRFATAYLVWDGGQLKRIILPIHGQGMWSTIYGYIALQADLNTIAAVTFYEQGETPGLGTQIQLPDWQSKWQGRQLWDGTGALRFRIATGRVAPESAAARYEVDALSGATVTADGVTNLVHYWFGEHGFQPFLTHLRETPPIRANN